jgi:hypothetical protein
VISKIEYLKLQTLPTKQLYTHPLFRKHFIERYINNLPLMALELFGLKVTHQQRKVLEALDFRQGRLAVPSGHGCHGVDTPIMLYDGGVKMVQDVKLGDLLMGHDGTKRTVISLARGEETLYEIETSDGIKSIYNASHVLCLVDEVGGEVEIELKDFLELWGRGGCGGGLGFYKKTKTFSSVKFDIKKITELGKGRYYGFTLLEDNRFLDGNSFVQSNTGKTATIGFITTAFQLLFPYSIVRIQAPQLKQVTNFSFKEINKYLETLESPIYIDGEHKYRMWSFLPSRFQRNIQKIYNKEYREAWYIEAKTAPKGRSENLSGQHQWAYLLIGDEASGIEDDHIKASLGGLTEKFNSCILFSQHTRLNGFFHEAVELLDRWKVVRLSSEESPLVEKRAIEEMRQSYNENEYRVRVLGLPPLYTDGNLLTPQEAKEVFTKEEWKGKDTPIGELDTLIITVDVAYRGVRNNSVITKTRVNRELLNTYSTNLTTLKPTKAAIKAFEAGLMELSTKRYKRIIIALDATAGGAEAYEELEKRVSELDNDTLECIDIVWGSARLIGRDKMVYRNQRAKAYAKLQEVVISKQLFISTRVQEIRTIKELSNIPFRYTGDDFKLQIASKDEMEIDSPDIADTLAMGALVWWDEVVEG